MTDQQVTNWLKGSFSLYTGGNVEVVAWHYEKCPVSRMNTAIILTARVDGETIKARWANKAWHIQGDADSFSHSTPLPTNSGYGRK